VYYAKSKGTAAPLSMPVRNPKTLERRCPGDIRFDGVGAEYLMVYYWPD